jgi:UDP-N-acetyl-2-amino-2-deoxyglucuronate dehydrogenase
MGQGPGAEGGLVSKIKLALVGLGSIAVGQYLPQLAGNPDAEVVAVCDVREEWSRQQAQRFGIAHVFTDFEQMLAEAPFDALINTASIPAHFPLNSRALQAGKHVYSQKPFATTVEEATTLIDEAARRGLKMSVSPIHMLRPEVQEMRRLVQSGALGKVSLVRCRSSHGGPEYFQYRDADPTWFFQEGGGPLLDMGVHGLHQVTGILGPARSVTCLSGVSETVRIARSGAFDGKEIRPEVDDNTLIMLDFGEATFAVIDSSYCVKAARGPGLEIYGSAGSIVATRRVNEDDPPFEVYRDDRGAGLRGWVTPILRLPRVRQAVGVLDLVAAIREDRRPVLTPEHARHVIEIMNTCLPAAREGRTIPLQTTF